MQISEQMIVLKRIQHIKDDHIEIHVRGVIKTTVKSSNSISKIKEIELLF